MLLVCPYFLKMRHDPESFVESAYSAHAAVNSE